MRPPSTAQDPRPEPSPDLSRSLIAAVASSISPAASDSAQHRDDRLRLTWYHGPFAAGFFQSGNTWDLHFIAPQFLAWFYPANSEIFHAVGMLAFDRDMLSPLLNLGWFIGCLFASGASGGHTGSAPCRWPSGRSR